LTVFIIRKPPPVVKYKKTDDTPADTVCLVYESYSLFLMILPDTVLGSSSRNTTILGYL